MDDPVKTSTDATGNEDRPGNVETVGEPVSAPFMFWSLVLLGMCGLTPAILLPQWRAYQRSVIAEQHENYLREQMTLAVQRERQMLDALRTDPALIRRIAQRELNLLRGNIQTISVDPSWMEHLPLERDEQTFTPRPVDLPDPLRRWVALLPDMNYDAVFCEPPTRTLVIAMSIGLICAALLLYGRPLPLQRYRNAAGSTGPSQGTTHEF